MTMKDRRFIEEFNEFISAPEIAPLPALREAVLTQVNNDLNPSSQSVFLKMLGIHAVVSLFSLSICSQFGVQSLKIYDAMESMMSVVGNTYCMAFCGLLYLGISVLALSFLLKAEEINVIRRHKFLQLTLLSGISLGVLLCVGAKVLLVPGALWILGSLAGGIGSLEIGRWIRSKFRGQLVFGI